jgi:hypothetical protein
LEKLSSLRPAFSYSSSCVNSIAILDYYQIVQNEVEFLHDLCYGVLGSSRLRPTTVVGSELVERDGIMTFSDIVSQTKRISLRLMKAR